VFAFAGGTTFQFMIHLVSDPTSFINRFFHRENKAWNGLVGQVIETDFFQGNRTDTVTTPRFAEIGMTFAGMNKNHGHFWSMTISLPNHFGSRAELFCGAGDGRSGA
jgi:hypothetical protein